MKKILISAFIGSENLGDEAIFESVLAAIDAPDRTITAVSVNEESTKRVHAVDTVYAKSPLGIAKAIRGSDVVIMGGGGIIQDQSSILNMLYYCYQLWVAKRSSVPVIFCFVGVGPVKYGLSRFLLKKLASAVKLAVVRDDKSARLLTDIVPSMPQPIVAFDPVLNHPFGEAFEVSDKHSDTVIVSLRKWYFSIPLLPASLARKVNSLGLRSKRYEHLTSGFARNFDLFLDRNPTASLEFVSFYDSEDVEVTEQVIAKMKHSGRCSFTRRGLNVADFIKASSNARLVFGMRLHSLILSAVAGTPFVAVDYSPKVRAFTNQMGLEKYMAGVQEYSGDRFYRILTQGFQDSDSNRQSVRDKQKQYASVNRDAFIAINQLIRASRKD